MSLFTGDLSQTVDLIGKGIQSSLAKAIESKFHEQIDPLIKELAIEYAKNVAAKIHTMQMHHDQSINISVIFNDSNIHTEKT